MRIKVVYSLLVILSITNLVLGQEYVDDESLFETQYEAPLTIDLDAEEEKQEYTIKKKKPKKSVIYGRKTKRGFSRSGYGKNEVTETFRYLKKHESPVSYVRDVYSYDFSKRAVVKSRTVDPKNAGLLHGVYRKMVDDEIIEEGIFYLGVKHGRWSKWNKHGILQSKEKYYKGWPKESKVAYHNREEKKIKEIIPVHFGEREGNYYAFHESGNMAAFGEYQFDHRVGLWREYYDKKRSRKREIMYSKDPFDDEFKPYVIREWNEYGKLIYELKK